MSLSISIRSGFPASIDVLRSDRASALAQIAGIVGFALLTALGAQVRIYLWEVPFTLQTLAVYGSGLYLGWRNGMFAQILYLVIGLFMPVYAGDGFGPAYLFGAVTAGYLLAYPLSAALAGAVSSSWNGPLGTLVAMLFSSLVLFAMGVSWLHFAADHATWMESLDRGWLRFIPIDLAKILLVAIVYSGTRHLTRKA